MAESHSHRFGQLIGELLETAIQAGLQAFATKHNLFLDKKGERLTRTGKKLTWTDARGNKHDLDFVLERNGTDSQLGVPVAFIETAWRRYTKHSRNKAQEIQGAIIPLVEKYSYASPFTGIVLAGEFTNGSITQLKSLGFSILYFPYRSIVEAFKKFDINAEFDETTAELEFKSKLESYDRLVDKHALANELMLLNKDEVDKFFFELETSTSRSVEAIIIWPLHGKGFTVSTLEDAVKFLSEYPEAVEQLPFMRYQIIINYNTGTKIDAICVSKADAIEFLRRNAGQTFGS